MRPPQGGGPLGCVGAEVRRKSENRVRSDGGCCRLIAQQIFFFSTGTSTSLCFFLCELETEGANDYALAVTRRPVSRARPQFEWLKVAGLIGAGGRITCSNHLLAAPMAAERIHFMGDIPLPSF